MSTLKAPRRFQVEEFLPCRHMPGSEEKNRVFQARLAAGLPVFHPDDSYDQERDGTYQFASNPLDNDTSHERTSDDHGNHTDEFSDYGDPVGDQ